MKDVQTSLSVLLEQFNVDEQLNVLEEFNADEQLKVLEEFNVDAQLIVVVEFCVDCVEIGLELVADNNIEALNLVAE